MDRPDLYVVARFLERMHEAETPPLKTDLQLRVRVNYTIFLRYLSWMVAKDYLQLVPDAGGAERVHLTPKGREAYATLVKWIRDAAGDL